MKKKIKIKITRKLFHEIFENTKFIVIYYFIKIYERINFLLLDKIINSILTIIDSTFLFALVYNIKIVLRIYIKNMLKRSQLILAESIESVFLLRPTSIASIMGSIVDASFKEF